MTKETHMSEHSVYGDWDDTHGNQFIVHWHPNGKHCTVFMLGGADYGGGITWCADGLDAMDVETIISDGANSYEIYDAMQTYVLNHNPKELY